MGELGIIYLNNSIELNIPAAESQIIISDKILEALDTAQFLVLMPALLALSLVGGCINMATFIKMGAREGINLNFLILSTTDFLFSAAQAGSYLITLIILEGYSSWYISLPDLNAILRSASVILKTWSLIVGTVIATVRCYFVSFPLYATSVLTIRRQLIVILILGGICTTFYVSMFCYDKFVIIIDSYTNRTRLKLIKGPFHITKYKNSFRFGTFSSFLSIILISVVVLIKSLKDASRSRQMMQSSVSDKSNSAKKNVQVIKCVVFVALVYLICNSPLILHSSLVYTLRGFAPGGRFSNEYQALGILMRVLGQLDMGLNFFGYYKFNSKFRNAVNKLFCKLCFKPLKSGDGSQISSVGQVAAKE